MTVATSELHSRVIPVEEYETRKNGRDGIVQRDLVQWRHSGIWEMRTRWIPYRNMYSRGATFRKATKAEIAQHAS